jgi:formylglycine-generating enzyme required for sulfatase activity
MSRRIGVVLLVGWVAILGCSGGRDDSETVTATVRPSRRKPSGRDGSPSATERPQSVNTLGMEFRLVPAGMYALGSADRWRFGDSGRCEQPRGEVEIARPYGIGRHEVTVGQFRRFVQESGYRTEAERDGDGCNGLNLATGRIERRAEWVWSAPGFEQSEHHPVVCVSWADAQAFCRWLGDRENCTYRLPTESEWEAACRAGTTTLFATGPDAASLKGAANVGDLSLRRRWSGAAAAAAWDDGFVMTAPVGSFQPNGFGLCDMHGNVGEWCQNWFDDPRTGGRWRAVRGGSWYNTPTSCRSSGRHDSLPTDRSTTNGFRVVREVRDGDFAALP